MNVCQCDRPSDDDTIDEMVGDPAVVELMKLMKWTSYTKEEMDEVFPENDRYLESLLCAGIVAKEGDSYSLDMSLQSFIHRLRSSFDISEVLGSGDMTLMDHIAKNSIYVP